MIRLRLKFRKQGPIRFIGHLDVMRYFQKVMRRAGIDIAYSEGFSPHQLMSFALPLSVGATSDGDYADVTLRSFSDLRALPEGQLKLPREEEALSPEALARGERDVLSRLNGVCAEGISFLDAMVLAPKALKAMSAVKACGWTLRIAKEAFPAEKGAGITEQELSAFLARKEIVVFRPGKKGGKQTDIRPFIYAASLDADGTLRLLLHAGSENNVKPALFAAALLSGLTDAAPETQELQALLQINRTETYQECALGEGACLEPLICRDGAGRIPLPIPAGYGIKKR